jgi:hypothetical protein
MLIPLNEPSNFRYIYINPATNHVHLLVPFIAGLDVSTDNTCKSGLELNVFFEGGAFNELESYKSTLEFHMSLLEEGDTRYNAKKERLTQINQYLEAVVGMRYCYQTVVNTVLARSSNLYSIQLRPRVQDPMSRVVNPVFTINRGNDSRGTPLSPLYNEMHEIFPGLALGKPDPRTDLINNALKILSQKATFDNIKHILKLQCAEQFKVDIDVENWIRPIPGENGVKEPIDKENIDAFMGFNKNENASSKDYIDALLGICAPNLWRLIPGSPFYLGIYDNTAHQTESLSMMTQFYLGVLNVYCRAKGISDKNFGVILDSSPVLSHELVDIVALALSRGEAVEPAIVAFFNRHQHEFNLSRELTSQDKDAIAQKFETTYHTVTATKENPHMDDFMFLDTEAQGESDIFITNKGLICTDASNIIPTTLQNQAYLAEIRQEARMHRDIVTPQDEPIITIDIEPFALIDKLDDVQWERLPKAVVDACRALPTFKIRELLDDVAKGKQDEAHTILESFEDKQALLRASGKFTDYSGRTFRCAAYEYAYWAKDTHMRRMLERHMDDETKAFMLEKIDAMEHSGLAYQQHGVAYQNAHYDMSFALRNLSVGEFHQLKTIAGRSSAKIQQATDGNYQNISFTATEYEALKRILEQYRPTGIFSFFFTSPAKALSEKLQFDFHSLITALDIYVTNYDKWDYHKREEAWMKIGKAQRDVPAHVAHEYCRLDRSFDPLPPFNEETLPRMLTFNNYVTNDEGWFPLSASSSGLGFEFALIRRGDAGGVRVRAGSGGGGGDGIIDLTAVRHLDEVRIADLTLSRENLTPVDYTSLRIRSHAAYIPSPPEDTGFSLSLFTPTKL